MPSQSRSVVQRTNRILDAATDLFLAQGFRATTMEAIAHEASVAKPTLYKYFSDKEAVFQALSTRLMADLKAGIEHALAGDEPTPVRVARALTNKHKRLFELMAGSAFAEELYSESSRLAGPAVSAFDKWLEDEILMTLVRGGYRDAMRMAPLLVAAAEGVAKRAKSADAIGPALWTLTEALLN